MKRLHVEYERCVGCDLCAMRCSLEKTGRVNPSQSRVRIARIEERGVTLPAVCRHCEEPRCLPACRVDAIHKDPLSGGVSIDEAKCIGCMLCVKACPYGGPVDLPTPGRRYPRLKALCDFCGGQPACVEVCPTATLWYGDANAEQTAREAAGLEELARNLAALQASIA